MSSVPRFFSNDADLSALRFARMSLDDLAEVQNIENDVYPHPWSRGNFIDSLYSGYDCWVVRQEDGMLAGYFLIMFAVDEAHLLNITVRRDLQRRGLGRALLDKVAAIARERAMMSVLLEVRPTNLRALAVYRQYGFLEIGKRKGYYPAANNTREDAIVMRLVL
ncbi:MAG TPA: ribosomal protein S18-alanine N-acetyltransferase [Paucimonas sp.]|nr:ribosomal protein S18-alanine N-acetyltransferase [Paucimonas sp.]